MDFVLQLENLSLMVEGVFSDDAVLQLEAMTHFRKLLSDFEPLAEDRCLPIHEVVRTGVVPRFVGFLEQHNFPQLQVPVLSSTKFSVELTRSLF